VNVRRPHRAPPPACEHFGNTGSRNDRQRRECKVPRTRIAIRFRVAPFPTGDRQGWPPQPTGAGANPAARAVKSVRRAVRSVVTRSGAWPRRRPRRTLIATQIRADRSPAIPTSWPPGPSRTPAGASRPIQPHRKTRATVLSYPTSASRRHARRHESVRDHVPAIQESTSFRHAATYVVVHTPDSAPRWRQGSRAGRRARFPSLLIPSDRGTVGLVGALST
jgi:hypothetical protein